MDLILRMVCVYTKLGWQRMKGGFMSSEKMKGRTILNLVTLVMRARYVLMIEGQWTMQSLGARN